MQNASKVEVIIPFVERTLIAKGYKERFTPEKFDWVVKATSNRLSDEIVDEVIARIPMKDARILMRKIEDLTIEEAAEEIGKLTKKHHIDVANVVVSVLISWRATLSLEDVLNGTE